jgi:hypothetical protein
MLESPQHHAQTTHTLRLALDFDPFEGYRIFAELGFSHDADIPIEVINTIASPHISAHP